PGPRLRGVHDARGRTRARPAAHPRRSRARPGGRRRRDPRAHHTRPGDPCLPPRGGAFRASPPERPSGPPVPPGHGHRRRGGRRDRGPLLPGRAVRQRGSRPMTTAEYPLRSVRLGFALALGLLTAAPLQAQRDTIVVAGREYAASALQEALLGDDYRDVWVAPVRVEVLDLDRFAGGLPLSERGRGKQTRSLRFRAPDGREYVFRSVNKYPDLAEERALEGTVVAAAVRDQISSIHPTAALVLPPLLAAVGVLHVEPHLVVMPDDPRLGEFREEFAGMLGLLELRPDEVEGGAAF